MRARLPELARAWLVCAWGLLLAATPSIAQDEAADVFQLKSWPAGIGRRAIDATPIIPDFERLATLAVDDAALLRVSPATLLSGVVERIERRTPARFSVIRRLDDDALGFFILAVEEDAAAGFVSAPSLNQAYRLGYVADGVHELEPVSSKRFGQCLTESEPLAPRPDSPLDQTRPAPTAAPDPNAAGNVSRSTCAAPPQHLDAMIYYTTAARRAAGGVNAANAECQLAVDTANVTYANSAIPARMVLVFRGEITYTETGDFGTDGDCLQDPSDGHMDNVHAERNTYGGDFVARFLSDAASPACGKARTSLSKGQTGLVLVLVNLQ